MIPDDIKRVVISLVQPDAAHNVNSDPPELIEFIENAKGILVRHGGNHTETIGRTIERIGKDHLALIYLRKACCEIRDTNYANDKELAAIVKKSGSRIRLIKLAIKSIEGIGAIQHDGRFGYANQLTKKALDEWYRVLHTETNTKNLFSEELEQLSLAELGQTVRTLLECLQVKPTDAAVHRFIESALEILNPPGAPNAAAIKKRLNRVEADKKKGQKPPQ